MARLSIAQLTAQLEELRVRCDRQEAVIASLQAENLALRASAAPQMARADARCAQALAAMRARTQPINHRYTTRAGEVYEVVPSTVSGRVVKTHKFVGMAGVHA